MTALKYPMSEQQIENSWFTKKDFEFDFLVFIGRFRPFHRGHLKVLQEAMKRARHVVVAVGSCRKPRNVREPWVFEEVRAMVHGAACDAEREGHEEFKDATYRLHLQPITDAAYSDTEWVLDVQRAVSEVTSQNHRTRFSNKRPRIGLIGYEKDATSYYLKLFPQWSSVGVQPYGDLSATQIRDMLFGQEGALEDPANKALLDYWMPAATQRFLLGWQHTEGFRHVREEYEYVRDYKQSWAAAPYPPVFVTADAVVVQGGHILMVRRGAMPGRGQLALPGGFINQGERIIEACVRELREETGLKVPKRVLEGSIRGSNVYDAPNRSSRGRTITHATYFDIQPQPGTTGLAEVKGSDDAVWAGWLQLGSLVPEEIFEDHYSIIRSEVGRY